MEEILKQILGSQKDIQKTLQQQSQVLQQHGKILEQQGEALQQQSSQLDSLQKGQTTLESHIDLLDSNQIKLETRIENEIIEKIRALYDARSVQNDINTRIIDTLERIETKIDVLQMETAHVRKLKRNRNI
jgi:cell division protein FtsB